MQELFGDLERLTADLFPYRWPIAIAFLAAVVGGLTYAFRARWHVFLLEHRLATLAIGIPVVALFAFVGWDLGSPLFTNKTVEEEFPFSFAAEVPKDMAQEDVEKVISTLAKVEDEPMDEDKPQEIAIASATVSPEAAENQGAVTLKVGAFRDQDGFHKGSGVATIYRSADGSLLQRLEEFAVTNGPDLHVLLSSHPDPNGRGDLDEAGYIDAGKLKGNRGNQNYPLQEADLDVESLQSVVIYCKPCHVVFSVATLEDAG
jgi:hypothetical protein